MCSPLTFSRGSVTSSIVRNPIARCTLLHPSPVALPFCPLPDAGHGGSEIVVGSSSQGETSELLTALLWPVFAVHGQAEQAEGRKVADMLYSGWVPYPAGHHSSTGPLMRS